MKEVTSFTLNLAAAAVLIVLASATIAAAAGTDTCVGAGAIIGGTCTPLTNTTSGDNDRKLESDPTQRSRVIQDNPDDLLTRISRTPARALTCG